MGLSTGIDPRTGRALGGSNATLGAGFRGRVSETVTSAGSRLAEAAARRETWLIVAAAIVWLLVRVWYAFKPLWFDELFTFYLSRLPHIHDLFQALPADGNPPLYYLLARASMRVFGETEFALRLPAMLGFLGAALAVYRYVRHRRAAVFAFLGMLLLLSGPMSSYGSEARSYSLMLGFTGLTLVGWQSAAERTRSRALALLGVAVGIAGAIASHHYGAVHVGVALAFGESVRIYQRKRLDIPLYAAAAAGLCMLAVTVPFAIAAHQVMLDYVRQSTAFWAKPGLRSLLSYKSMLPLWFLPVFLLLLWLSQRPRQEQPAREGADGVPAYEIAAAVGLALMVPIVMVLTAVTTGYYMDRYAIGAAMGIAMLVGLVAPVLGRGRQQAAAVAALCAVLLGGEIAFRPAASVALHGTTYLHAASAMPDSLLSRAPGTSPIVIASALEFSQDWWYAPPSLRARLRYLADLPFAVHQPDFLPEVSLVADQPYLPSKVDDFHQFLAAHRQFLVYADGMPRLEWTIPRLQAASYSLKLIGREGESRLYLAEAPN